MIVVTGAAGFIGSNVVDRLNDPRTVIVDLPGAASSNLNGLKFGEFVPITKLRQWLRANAKSVEAIVHMGACADTTADWMTVMERNVMSSAEIWTMCHEHQIRLVYASSAATYGNGKLGFDDKEPLTKFDPLNHYARSKHLFDIWAMAQDRTPNGWAGLKFFNVYGPRESHKGRMASVAYQAYVQIKETGMMKLFASDRPHILDGEQARDFVYVQDCADAILHFARVKREKADSVFNVGTGQAKTFATMAKAVFAALGKEPAIDYVPMPEDLKEKYQYFSQAEIDKLVASGFRKPFYTIEEGVFKYVQQLELTKPCHQETSRDRLGTQQLYLPRNMRYAK